ncbi:hypothetical protein F4779DRAFT_188428 [Xylariaceae sp. FL0662B]|nr:hypothetical protein F4779DRAFT_188428 [Xylariaceae sp. FL0662B]
MLQVKYNVGLHEIECLKRLGRYEEAKDESRKRLRYWTTVLKPGNSTDYMLYRYTRCLVDTLKHTTSLSDKREIIDICKIELESLPSNEQNMRRRHRVLCEMADAASLSHQDVIVNSTLQMMLDETALRGGNSYRKEIWDLDTWVDFSSLLQSKCELDLQEEIVLAAIEWSTDKYGTDDRETIYLRILRAQGLLGWEERLAEAEAIAQDCIATLERLGLTWSFQYVRSYEILGAVFEDRQRYEEAYEAYNRALFHIQQPAFLVPRIRLLVSCGWVARKFNLGLAETHYALGLSLILDTKNHILLDNRDVLMSITNIIGHYVVEDLIGADARAGDILELLVIGLDFYGIEVIYRRDSNPRKHIKDTSVTIHLEDPTSFQKQVEDPAVCAALINKIWIRYAFELLIRLAVALLNSEDIGAAERTFKLLYTVMERVEKKYITKDFIRWALTYIERRYRMDNDVQKVQDAVEWTRVQIYGKLEDIEGDRAWIEANITSLWECIGALGADVEAPGSSIQEDTSSEESESEKEMANTSVYGNQTPSPASQSTDLAPSPLRERAHIGSRTVQKLHDKFSRAMPFKLFSSSSYWRSGWSWKGRFRPTPKTAASPINPATAELQRYK